MRNWFHRTVLALALVGATSATAFAQTYEFKAKLSGGAETPALNTGAFGLAEVVLDVPRQEITYTIRIWNLPTGIVGAHFHVGAGGTPGPVVLDIPITPAVSNDFVLSGTLKASAFRPREAQGIRTPEDFIQAMVGGQSYINIHTQANPAGEIRGDLPDGVLRDES